MLFLFSTLILSREGWRSHKIIDVSADLEFHLPRDLLDEVQPNYALVLGLVQGVLRTDLGQELEGDEAGDLTQDIGRGNDLKMGKFWFCAEVRKRLES